jgi:hypothetical protein
MKTRRSRWLQVVFVVAVMVLFAGCTPTTAVPSEPERPTCNDHFKVYAVDNLEAGHEVKLEDQFDRERDMKEEVKLEAIEFFANPVRKDGSEIQCQNAHLTWYRFQSPGPEIVVTLKNQFDDQTWQLGEAVYLLVPTEKQYPETGGGFPEELDHFKCYKGSSEEFSEREVVLQDQFDTSLDRRERVRVEKPAFFCNPVSKNGAEIKNPENHLACYLITSEEESLSLDIKVRNQFGETALTVTKSYMLCLPSEKIEFKVLE